MERADIEVGRSLRDMAAEAKKVWRAAEEGQMPAPRVGICFRDWSVLNAVLTPKRYDLLRHLRRERASGVRALARSLDRDVKRVHEDVVALAEIGLVTRADDGSLSSDVDEIGSVIHVSPSPNDGSGQVPPDMRSLGEESVDQARRAVDNLMIAAQRGMRLAETGDTASRTADRVIGTRVLSFAEMNIRSAFDLASKLVRAKDVREVIALETDYARMQMSALEEQARELGTMVQTTAQGAVQSAPADGGKHRRRATRGLP